MTPDFQTESVTLYWGDCLVVMPTIARVDHVITDPPYSQETSENARTNKDRGKSRFIGFDGISPAEIAPAFLRVADRWVVAFCAMEQLGEYRAVSGPEWVRGSAWRRTNSAPQFTGDRPGQAHEGIAIMHPAGRKRWNWGGRVFAPGGPTANSVGNQDRVDHPTPKPLWLMLECLEAFTSPGDTILDPFMGSGTTGVACLRLGRKFIGIEKDPKYFETAKDRLIAESQGQSLRSFRAGQLPMFGGEP